MKLRLKPGYHYEPNCVVSDGRSVVTHSPESKTVTIMLGFAVSQQLDVVNGSWTETAFRGFNAAGWENPWWEVVSLNDDTDAELTAAAEGEGPVAPEPSLAEQIAQAQEVWAASAEHMRKCIDEWWAGLTPPVIMPPAPRLCAVDRLEAAGYKLCAIGNIPMFISSSTRIRVCIGGALGQYRVSTIGGIDVIGDPLPGLNAALESLLSKPVGAVTVAQILGVSP